MYYATFNEFDNTSCSYYSDWLVSKGYTNLRKRNTSATIINTTVVQTIPAIIPALSGSATPEGIPLSENALPQN